MINIVLQRNARMKNFQPTYLMIKRHVETGLLYFCKTATRDPLKYNGSGVYWKSHLRVHGKKVETIWYELFENEGDLVEFALFFSDVNNIVTATGKNGKKIWANEVPENGLQGGQNKGMPSPLKGSKQPHVTLALKGKKRPEHSNAMKGRKQTPEHSAAIGNALRGKQRSKEHCDNISKAKKGKKTIKNREFANRCCIVCGTVGKGPNMTRYHFENCKHKGKINE